jgi:hypothetical protein
MRNVTQRWNLPTLLVAVGLLVGCANASTDAEKAEQTGSDNSGGEVVAKIGDQPITMAEVDEKSRAISLKPYQDLYNQRRQAIEQIVADRLLEQEAEAAGMTATDLMNKEVYEKAPQISEEQIQGFYTQNKAQMGGRELDDNLKSQIGNYLAAQNLSQLQRDFLERLKSKANVSITLEPPRVDVVIAANDPTKGPADAPVTIVEYSDFQ